MKIVVIGGTGLIGAKLVSRLRRCGHEVAAASLETGVNIITGEGLGRALEGAEVVVDVANSPSFEPRAALEFFETAGRNLLAAERSAGVGHHLALSVVGTDRLADNQYLPAKLAQEKLVQTSGIPYTILRSTQFFEFIGAIIDSATVGDEVRLSPALFQPVAADEVVAAMADLALELPLNSIVEVAGPERRPMNEFARQFLAARKDPRRVIADPAATYFGSVLDDRSLTAGKDARLGEIHLEDWLRQRKLMPTPQRTIAGLTVPDTQLVARAMEEARAVSEPYLFNHAVRSWLFAVQIADQKGTKYDAEVVAVASLLHDLGLTPKYLGQRRFEVEGADAARSLAKAAGVDERRAQLIWYTVALNATLSLSPYAEPEVGICTVGAGIDYAGFLSEQIPKATMAAILAAYPRLQFKQRLKDCVSGIAKARPQTTYDTFIRDFGERFVPGYKPSFSTVDALVNAPFEE